MLFEQLLIGFFIMMGAALTKTAQAKSDLVTPDMIPTPQVSEIVPSRVDDLTPSPEQVPTITPTLVVPTPTVLPTLILPTSIRIQPSKTPQPTAKVNRIVPSVSMPRTRGRSCSGPDLDCADFQTHQEAQSFFNECGFTATNDPMRLDGTGVDDGIACESLP